MSRVLFIKANARGDEESRSFKIANVFMDEYRKNNPDDEIITLDLYQEGITVLPYGKLSELHAPKGDTEVNNPIIKYAYQFRSADKIVIAAPFWNMGIPAILKAYIDYVMVNGITFKYTAEGPIGLMPGRKVAHITSRGGVYSQGPAAAFEMGDRYLRTILGFLGVTDFTTIAAEGLDVVENDANKIVNEAIEKAVALAKTF